MEADRERRLSEVSALLRDRAGLDPASLGDRAVAIAAATGDWSSQAAFQDLLDDLLVPETWFFRDAAPFRVLREAALSRRHDVAGEAYRALSLACSTGEEAYSIAMTLAGAGLPLSTFSVLGVDLSRRALRAAERAEYRDRSFRESDADCTALQQRFCVRTGDQWSVEPELRRRVSFRGGNAAAADLLAGEAPYHAVFCRNLLIYLHEEARRTALANLRRLLAPGGLLVCGHAEARIIAAGGFCNIVGECTLAFTDAGRAATEDPKPPETRPPAPLPRPARIASPRRNAPPARQKPVAAPPDLDPPAKLLAARAAADAGRLTEAETLCRQVLTTNPSSAEAHCLLGLAAQTRGDDAEARRLYERTLYLDPKHYEAIVHLMLLAQRRGDRRAAENYRRRARAAAPEEAK